MSMNVNTWKLKKGSEPLAQVLTFVPKTKSTKIVSKALNGATYIQTVGDPSPYATIKILVSSECIERMNDLEATGALVTVQYKDRLHYGFIESEIEWKTELPGEWYTAEISLLIQDSVDQDPSEEPDSEPSSPDLSGPSTPLEYLALLSYDKSKSYYLFFKYQNVVYLFVSNTVMYAMAMNSDDPVNCEIQIPCYYQPSTNPSYTCYIYKNGAWSTANVTTTPRTICAAGSHIGVKECLEGMEFRYCNYSLYAYDRTKAGTVSVNTSYNSNPLSGF